MHYRKIQNSSNEKNPAHQDEEQKGIPDERTNCLNQVRARRRREATGKEAVK
jgi:hypothetical protein